MTFSCSRQEWSNRGGVVVTYCVRFGDFMDMSNNCTYTVVQEYAE